MKKQVAVLFHKYITQLNKISLSKYSQSNILLHIIVYITNTNHIEIDVFFV